MHSFNVHSHVTWTMCVCSHQLYWFSMETDLSSAPHLHPAHRWLYTDAGTGWVWPGLTGEWVCVGLLPPAPTPLHTSPPLMRLDSRLPAAMHLYTHTHFIWLCDGQERDWLTAEECRRYQWEINTRERNHKPWSPVRILKHNMSCWHSKSLEI